MSIEEIARNHGAYKALSAISTEPGRHAAKAEELAQQLRRYDALLAQLAEALQGMVSGNEFARVGSDPSPTWTRRVTPLPEALDAACAALAAYRKESQ